MMPEYNIMYYLYVVNPIFKPVIVEKCFVILLMA